ncbi:MAG: L-threonylcarbamoyladenylate synthase [Pseudomonadota bacterium]|nr:L-threonylcarbamoyladenylate synthase [Pseudomonadota bacterium]
MTLLLPDAQDIAEAVAALRRGEVIGLPTETVYGLAGDATNTDAIRRIFAIKGRPADHPLIVHLGAVAQVADWAADVPAAALTLAAAFWPGPMTLILKKAAQVSDLVTGGQDSVGLRIPNHPVALGVLNAFGGGLAAPSANRFGHVSPTTAQHVRDEFGSAVALVLDGGPCSIGIESTIIDLTGITARILRPGQISRDAIAAVIGNIEEGQHSDGPRVSGALASHYAPRTPTENIPRSRLAARWRQCHEQGETVLVLSIGHLPASTEGLALSENPEDYARHLYAALRTLDAEGADRILVERTPDSDAWRAIGDRLQRAANGVDTLHESAG